MVSCSFEKRKKKKKRTEELYIVKARYKKMIVSYHQKMQSFNGLSKFKSHSNTNVNLASG